MTEEPGKKTSLLARDVKFVAKHAALIGAVLAIFCHLVPPTWRVPCDAIKNAVSDICSFGKD